MIRLQVSNVTTATHQRYIDFFGLASTWLNKNNLRMDSQLTGFLELWCNSLLILSYYRTFIFRDWHNQDKESNPWFLPNHSSWYKIVCFVIIIYRFSDTNIKNNKYMEDWESDWHQRRIANVLLFVHKMHKITNFCLILKMQQFFNKTISDGSEVRGLVIWEMKHRMQHYKKQLPSKCPDESWGAGESYYQAFGSQFTMWFRILWRENEYFHLIFGW